MTKENKILISLIGISTVFILILGTIFATKTQPPVLESSGDAKVEVLGAKLHDWGEIDIEGGNVEKTFLIKNAGTSNLDISNFKTSCMCTEAQVTIAGVQSPAFGMHATSSWKGTLAPDSTAEVKVVFDPLFHGPQGTGPITRLVSFDTNDPSNRTVEFRLTGNVVSKEVD
ncbi:MAG: DUF1573 domain-containing protein [Patescibacteria group bacterium]